MQNFTPKTKRKARCTRRGSVALSAIAALVIILIVVLGLMALASAVLLNGSHTSRTRALRNLAEAGLQYGYWSYEYNGAVLPSSGSMPLGPGQFSVSLTDNSANVANTFKVTSTATVRNDTLTMTRIFPSATWNIVDLSHVVNSRVQNIYTPDSTPLPEGPQNYGGVPFDIETAGGNNCWNANTASGTQVATINTDIKNPMEVHTLINTQWGQAGGPYLQIEFYGDGGAYYLMSLYGNSDVRDWHTGGYTQSINNTTTTNMFYDGTRIYDKQRIVLPAAFQNGKLKKIVITDTGSGGFQRALLMGITVKSQ